MMDELIVYQSLHRPSTFQTSLKPLGQLNSNLIWGAGKKMNVKVARVVLFSKISKFRYWQFSLTLIIFLNIGSLNTIVEPIGTVSSRVLD